MALFTIQPYDPSAHRAWAEKMLLEQWGSLRMVSRGVLYDVLDYPAFVALVEGQPQGLATYRVDGSACELLLLQSLIEGMGLASALVEAVKAQVQATGCTHLWLVTTNDNIHAIRWYQRRGFTFAEVRVNALEVSRQIKPEIPLIGMEGIPLRDEIIFEIALR